MSKYSIFFTKQDAKQAYQKIETLENSLDMKFDWKKIKRAGGDEIHFLIHLLEKKQDKANQRKLI